jgi:hypothetical protein
MKANLNWTRRFAYGVLGAVMLVAVAIPATTGTVAAAGQVTERDVNISNSTPGATSVKYNVQFKPATTGTIGGIVVDFCGDSPIIGSTTCTLPTNFTLGATVTLSAGYTGMGTGWATTNSLQGAAAAGQKQVAVLTNATPQSVTAGTVVDFELTGITNPSSTGTFYARVYTFDTSANTTTNYTATTTARVASPAGKVDYGGVALSTVTAISVSATVQEQLTFCVSKAAPGAACSGLTTPNVVLGSGTPTVLGTALATDTVYHQMTTNAVNGVSVALKNTSSTTCAGLSRDGGVTCPIAAVGSGTSAAAINTGDGVFGVRVAAGTGGTGTVSPAGIYNTTTYSMRTQTYGNYGDPVSASTGATSNVNSLLTYGAAAAATTPAGVYTATHSLIATGSY